MRLAGQFPQRQEPVGSDRHGLAFYLNRLQGLEGEKASRLRIGGLPDQGFARFGQGAQPGGDVDGIPGNVVSRRLFKVKLPRYCKAGIDADMHIQGLPYGFLDFQADASHHLMNLAGGFDRPHRIVFVGPGNPKEGHHLIPGELLDVAFIFDYYLGNLAEYMAYQVFDFFRVQAL